MSFSFGRRNRKHSFCLSSDDSKVIKVRALKRRSANISRRQDMSNECKFLFYNRRDYSESAINFVDVGSFAGNRLIRPLFVFALSRLTRHLLCLFLLIFVSLKDSSIGSLSKFSLGSVCLRLFTDLVQSGNF